MQFWSGEQLAIEVSGPQGNTEIVVRRPYALVGALGRADVRLSGDGVQKREALLYVADGKVMCRRLEAALPEITRELLAEEWLRLGTNRLRARVVVADHRGRSEALSIDSEIKPRIPVLRVRRKGRQSVNRRLWSTLALVGRGEDCEVPLLSTTVSLYHCILFRESNRLWCVDLGSGNGTLLNGQAIECAPVEMGSRLQVGDFELEFQRYSRRSAPSTTLGENAAGSQLRLDTPSLAEEMQEELVSRGSDIGAQATESIFGSNIGRSEAALHAPASSLSGLAALPAPLSADFHHLEAKQAELIAKQTELQLGLDSLTEANARVRSDQEAFAQQLSARLDEHRTALIEELKQQSQADRQTLAADLLLRLEEVRRSETLGLTTSLDSQRQSLSQELLSRLEDFRQSESQALSTRMESQRQSLLRELLVRLEESRQSQAHELLTRIDLQRQGLWQDLAEKLEALAKTQTEQLLAQTNSLRQALSEELLQRLDGLAKSQAQQLKLQAETQRHTLAQELTKRLETALEGHVQQTPAASDPSQQVVSQLWSQRLDDLRNAQSDEIALAVATQGQALSQELAQRLEELQTAQSQRLTSQIEQLRQSLFHELARQLEAQAAKSLELEKSASLRQESLQQSQAKQLALQIEQQRQSLAQDLTRQLETQAAQSRELLAKSAIQRQEELSGVQSQQVAAQIDHQRQSLSQELARQLEAQQAALSRELLAQIENQRTAFLKEQQASADAVTQRLGPLLSSLEQLGSQQSQFGSRLAAQAERIQAMHQALAGLRSRVDEQRTLLARESDPDSRPMTVVSLDSDAPEAVDAAPDSGMALLPQTAFTEDSSVDHAPLVRKAAAPIPEDDRLLHFVSDRLAEMDSGRQRRIVVYWAIAIAAAGMLGAGAWAIWNWFGPQSS